MPSGISLTKVRDITDEQIAQVRRFNRIVTRRVGALDEAVLARGEPLGQARVLWEVGPDGADVRALRARLGLDSGYLSRVLQALAADDLLVVEPSERDGRVRTADVVVLDRGARYAESRSVADAEAGWRRGLVAIEAPQAEHFRLA